jgi:hypothetical protein
VKWLIRLYPRDWQDRYGGELAELLDERAFGPRLAADLVRSAVRVRVRRLFRPAGGGARRAGSVAMMPGGNDPQARATQLAALGLVVMAPTLVFATASILAYNLGAPGMASAVDPVITGLAQHAVVEVWLGLAPLAALLLAVIPMLRVRLDRTDGALSATLVVRPRALNVVVAVMAVALIGLLAGYVMTEFLAEAGGY